jgi:hypothetical protein
LGGALLLVTEFFCVSQSEFGSGLIGLKDIDFVDLRLMSRGVFIEGTAEMVEGFINDEVSGSRDNLPRACNGEDFMPTGIVRGLESDFSIKEIFARGLLRREIFEQGGERVFDFPGFFTFHCVRLCLVQG